MESTNPLDFEASLQQKRYNFAQIFLYQYMQATGEVKDWADYTKRIAPIFELLANGSMEYQEPDLEKIREEVKSLTKGSATSYKLVRTTNIGGTR